MIFGGSKSSGDESGQGYFTPSPLAMRGLIIYNTCSIPTFSTFYNNNNNNNNNNTTLEVARLSCNGGEDEHVSRQHGDERYNIHQKNRQTAVQLLLPAFRVGAERHALVELVDEWTAHHTKDVHLPQQPDTDVDRINFNIEIIIK